MSESVSARVIVEHAIGGIKRLRKAVQLRTTNMWCADLGMQLAAGLLNFRVAHRQESYATSRARTQARLQPFDEQTRMSDIFAMSMLNLY